MTAVIVDDELHCIESLQHKLDMCSQPITVKAVCTNAALAPKLIQEQQPDVVFLDINLGAFTGFEVLEKLQPPLPKIIFTTAYDHYAIRAFRYNAIDYLLKPIDAEELEQAILKARNTQSYWPGLHQIQQAVTHLSRKASNLQKLALPTITGFELVALDDLVRLEAASNYTHFYLHNGKKMTVSKTLKEYDDLLEPEGFVRIHQSHMINMRYLKSYQKGKNPVAIMQDDIELDIGATRRDAFMEKCKAFFRVG
jgi:two-component system LytT family response regulator